MQWTIETGVGERGSGKSVRAARQDDIYIYIYTPPLHSCKELTNELSTPVPVKRICKQKKK